MFGIVSKYKKNMYRRENSHNYTIIKNPASYKNIIVGIHTYGTINALMYRGENSKLYIGNYCSIANECVFLLGGEHDYNKVSTYPFKAKIMNIGEATNKGDIVIKDDVWIGYGSTILSGVTIGQGAIIGAKSIVSKNVPPYAIYVGNKIIKYRFKPEIIERLLEIDYSKLEYNKIRSNIDLFYEIIDEGNIEKIINYINS